jgi:hypothetical protein|nr:MAG TPA_asm: hypothetical protein [Caudoviricetes sp.]
MKYTTVVGPEKDAFELSIAFRAPLRSGNVTVYNRQGERLIWKATFSLTRDDIRQLARELRHVSQLLDAENETQEEK